MKLREWFRPPKHVMAIFLVVTVASAGALIFLVRLLLEQDKTVEVQRRQERMEEAADRAVARLQSALKDLELELDSRTAHVNALPEGVVVVRVGPSGGIHPKPEGGLLFYPDEAQTHSPPDTRFAEGEQREYAENDFDAAARLYRSFVDSPELTVRAAAFVRLARVHLKAGETNEARADYDRLSQLPDIRVEGLPAPLVARVGRASLFEGIEERRELQQEASELAADLQSGRWRLVRSEYEFYSGLAKTWLGTTASVPAMKESQGMALAETFGLLWQENPWKGQRVNDPPSRHLMQSGGQPVLAIWRAIEGGAAIALAGFNYLGALCDSADRDRSRNSLRFLERRRKHRCGRITALAPERNQNPVDNGIAMGPAGLSSGE